MADQVMIPPKEGSEAEAPQPKLPGHWPSGGSRQIEALYKADGLAASMRDAALKHMGYEMIS